MMTLWIRRTLRLKVKFRATDTKEQNWIDQNPEEALDVVDCAHGYTYRKNTI